MERIDSHACFKIRDILAFPRMPLWARLMKENFHRNILSGFLFLIFMLGNLTLHAQQIQVTGSVKDANTGEALLGVNVIILGTTQGTVTDFEGKYSLNIGVNDTLQFSFIGYLDEIIPLAGQTVIDVQLVPDIEALEEVVVVGYGTMKKSDVTGAIVSIEEEDFTQVKTTNVIGSLQGKAAGVDISRSSGEAGSGFTVRVRGERSLSGNNDPLYIVDGIQYGSGIDINPNDIASIEILKDVASTAIYGAKGANGVIIITTKQGVEGKPKISFSTYVGLNKPMGELPYLDRSGYMKYKEDLIRLKEYYRTGEWVDTLQPTYVPFEERGIANGTDTKWFDEVKRNGYLQNYFLSVYGGKQGISYNLSLDYTNEIGMLKQDDYKRYLIKGGMDIEVNKHLSVGTSNILSFKDRNRMSFPAKNILLMNPLAVPYDSAGNLLTNPMSPTSEFQTPLWYFQEGYYTREELTTRIFSNVYANVKIFEGLTLNSTLNVDFSTFREGSSERAGETDVNVYMYIKPSKDYTWTNILTFDRTFGIHHLQITGVHEMLWGSTERYRLSGRNPSIDNSLWYAPSSWDPASLSVELDPGAKDDDAFYYTEGSQLAFLGRVNYGLLGRYILTASIRFDGSSRLAEGHKWDYFPSASVAWNIHEEDFMKSTDFISQLKLRLSYGVSGNYSVPIYSAIDKVNTDPLYYEFGTPEAVIFGYRPVFAGNPNLGWEKTTAFNVGLDFGIINNRISGNLDIYNAHTTDLLQKRILPPHAAIPYIYDNVGETKTNGVELMIHSINFAPKKAGGFKWTTDLSFTYNDEEIVELSSGVLKDEANGWFVGYPIKVRFDYEQDGIWQFSDSTEMQMYIDHGMDLQAGDIKIKDQPDPETGQIDTVINENDRVVLGRQFPKWYGSLNNRFEFKGFDLSILITARIGQTVKDDVMNQFPIRDDYEESGMSVDYWTPVNPTNVAPRLDPSISAINYMPYSSALLYTDGSWVKIRDITLGYTLPSNVLDKIRVSSLRIYVGIQNAFVLYSPLYKRGRYDPEKGGSTSWPTPRTYLAGLTLDF